MTKKNETKVAPWVHSIAGGCGGALGAILTNPLEVVKTRLQSSSSSTVKTVSGTFVPRDHLLRNLQIIFKSEGFKALFKGLPATLFGTIPSRAIYFYSYNKSKSVFNYKDSPLVHIVSALSAGSSQILLTTPIWVVRTKQQLDQTRGYSLFRCARDIYRHNGFQGFWRGMTASLLGLSETVIFFLIYENLKSRFIMQDSKYLELSNYERLKTLFLISICSKATATSLCYPHEVIRTRLREETSQSRYRGVFQTLRQIRLEEGLGGWYSGLKVNLIRQIPNNAIMMCTVEYIIYSWTQYMNQ